MPLILAFPRLNAFGYWVNVPGAAMLIAAIVVGGWNTGWTGYPPLSAQLGVSADIVKPVGVPLFMMGVYFIGLSSIVGSANVLVTVVRMRAPGMTPFRMPIFVWAAVATSLIQLTATQLIGLSFLMVVVQRLLGMGFFDPTPDPHGYPVGNPVLFQHLFWFYSHPAVYVFILPGLGIVSELLPVFCRKPLFGYKWNRSLQSGHCPGRLFGMGAPYVHLRYGRVPAGTLHVFHLAGCRANRGQIL